LYNKRFPPLPLKVALPLPFFFQREATLFHSTMQGRKRGAGAQRKYRTGIAVREMTDSEFFRCEDIIQGNRHEKK
jgi:hypothetical protein